MIEIALLIWYVIGVAGFVFWWTNDFDLTTRSLVLAAYAGIVGPLSWLIGWAVHGGHFRVWVRKRK